MDINRFINALSKILSEKHNAKITITIKEKGDDDFGKTI